VHNDRDRSRFVGTKNTILFYIDCCFLDVAYTNAGRGQCMVLGET